MKKFVSSLSLGILLFFSAHVCSQAGVIDPKLQTVLEATDPDQPLPIIVTLADRANLRAIRDRDKRTRRRRIITALRSHADRTQRQLLVFLRNNGATRIVRLWATNSIAAIVPTKVIPELARQPRVQSVRLDGSFSAPAPSSGNPAGVEWNINAIHAPDLWELGHTAQGVIVANMDTGVDQFHPDLSPRWRGGTNSWLDPYNQHSAPFDNAGHGTQVMGLMVGGNAGGTAIGVAPGARWIAVKIFNDKGQAELSKVHQGFQWLLDPDGDPQTNDAPDIVNNSWALLPANACNLEFQPDIQVLRTAEIAVVFAAGNEGPNPSTSVSPANNPESLGVGSVNSAPTIAPSSSRGPSACNGLLFPELVAPGVNVNTADRSFGGLPLYIVVSGTSAAAPHVSGAMALLTGAFPAKTVAELESALRESSLDLGFVGPDDDYGNGFIDVGAAYNRLVAGLQNPIAVDDAYSVDEDTTLTVAAPGVLQNDSDPQNDPLTAVLLNGPARGTLTLDPTGSFTYTPAANFNGTDSFTYKASDGALDSNVAAVTITVNPINDAPVANDDSYSTAEDTPLTIAAPGVLGNDTDPEGDALAAVLMGGPAHGTLTLDPTGSFTYTPAANFNGTDSFTYHANDGSLDSNVATVTITITAVNDAPAFTTTCPTAATIGVQYTCDVDADDGDPEIVQGLTFSLPTKPTGMLIDGTTGVITWTPGAAQAGTHNVTVRLTDDGTPAQFTEQSFTITVLTVPVKMYLSLLNSGSYTVGSVTGVANEDILSVTGAGSFAMVFDGSDVGVGGLDIDAFSIVDATTIRMSFSTAGTVPGIAGTVDDSDIVQFVATSLGTTTAGSFSLFFDGSDVGLTTDNEDVDAVEILADGTVAISTVGTPDVPGVTGEQDEDLLRCGGTFGPTTTCTWSMYFDGSDVGLATNDGEDVDAAAIAGTSIYLSTLSAFSVTGLSGADEDVFVCGSAGTGTNTTCTYSPTLFFDGSTFGLGANDVDAIDVP